MVRFVRLCFGTLVRLFFRQQSLLLENLALRQQLVMLKRRLLLQYLRYHHEDRTHLGLQKGTPEDRIRSEASGRVLSQERLGGLHHRYNRAA